MGIPSYFSYIIRNHKKIIKKLDILTNSTKTDTNIRINNLYLDCNSIIYDSLKNKNLEFFLKNSHISYHQN